MQEADIVELDVTELQNILLNARTEDRQVTVIRSGDLK